jgi:hypothetical protein
MNRGFYEGKTIHIGGYQELPSVQLSQLLSPLCHRYIASQNSNETEASEVVEKKFARQTLLMLRLAWMHRR